MNCQLKLHDLCKLQTTRNCALSFTLTGLWKHLTLNSLAHNLYRNFFTYLSVNRKSGPYNHESVTKYRRRFYD